MARFSAKLPLLPLLTGVICGTWVADASEKHYFLPVIAISILLTFFRKTTITHYLLGFLSAYLLHGSTLEKQRAWLSTSTSHIELTGTIIDTGTSGQGPYLFKIFHSMDSELPTGTKLILLSPRHSNTKLQRGDMFHSRGKLETIPSLRNPYGFDLAQWRHRQGANINFLPTEQIKYLGNSSSQRIFQTLEQWRNIIRAKITTGLNHDSAEAQIIRAIVLGEKPPQTPSPSPITETFRLSGTLHLFAVSGLHVGMIAVIIHFILSWLPLPRLIRTGAIILSMLIYAGITGWNPPAVRAAIMGSIFIGGFLLKRQPSILNCLAASAILTLLWDGHQLFTSSFQLSYGVLLSIALITGTWNQLLKGFTEIDTFMPKSLLTRGQLFWLSRRRNFKNSLSVSLSAAMGSSPLIWLHFGIITPISIIAGIPLMIIVFIILALAILSLSLGSLIPQAAHIINHTNAFTAHSAYKTAHFFTKIPYGHWRKKPPRPKNGRIIIFDIPYGGAAHLLDLGGGILLDSGRDDHFTRLVHPTLSSLQVSPDSLIISHADSLHAGGMSQCLELLQPQQTLIPRRDQRSPSYQHFIRLADSLQHPLITPRLGQCFPIEEGVFLEILHAPQSLAGRGKADDTGLIIRLHWHDWRILFTSDAGIKTEERLLTAGIDLQADIIISGNNENDITGSSAFYQAVSPQAIIINPSQLQDTARISKHWKHTVQALGIKIIDQLHTGAVTITLEDNKLTLRPTLVEAEVITLSH